MAKEPWALEREEDVLLQRWKAKVVDDGKLARSSKRTLHQIWRMGPNTSLQQALWRKEIREGREVNDTRLDCLMRLIE